MDADAVAALHECFDAICTRYETRHLTSYMMQTAIEAITPAAPEHAKAHVVAQLRRMEGKVGRAEFVELFAYLRTASYKMSASDIASAGRTEARRQRDAARGPASEPGGVPSLSINEELQSALRLREDVIVDQQRKLNRMSSMLSEAGIDPGNTPPQKGAKPAEDGSSAQGVPSATAIAASGAAPANDKARYGVDAVLYLEQRAQRAEARLQETTAKLALAEGTAGGPTMGASSSFISGANITIGSTFVGGGNTTVGSRPGTIPSQARRLAEDNKHYETLSWTAMLREERKKGDGAPQGDDSFAAVSQPHVTFAGLNETPSTLQTSAAVNASMMSSHPSGMLGHHDSFLSSNLAAQSSKKRAGSPSIVGRRLSPTRARQLEESRVPMALPDDHPWITHVAPGPGTAHTAIQNVSPVDVAHYAGTVGQEALDKTDCLPAAGDPLTEERVKDILSKSREAPRVENTPIAGVTVPTTASETPLYEVAAAQLTGQAVPNEKRMNGLYHILDLERTHTLLVVGHDDPSLVQRNPVEPQHTLWHAPPEEHAPAPAEALPQRPLGYDPIRHVAMVDAKTPVRPDDVPTPVATYSAHMNASFYTGKRNMTPHTHTLPRHDSLVHHHPALQMRDVKPHLVDAKRPSAQIATMHATATAPAAAAAANTTREGRQAVTTPGMSAFGSNYNPVAAQSAQQVRPSAASRFTPNYGI